MILARDRRWNNWVLSTGLIMWISHCKEIWKLTFRVLALRRSESLTTVSLETYPSIHRRWKSANEFLHRITLMASNALPNLWLLLLITIIIKTNFIQTFLQNSYNNSIELLYMVSGLSLIVIKDILLILKILTK